LLVAKPGWKKDVIEKQSQSLDAQQQIYDQRRQDFEG
jgi:hypothetical protein